MIEKKSLDYEKTILVGIVDSNQNHETTAEYLDELEVSLINLDIIFAHDPTTKLTKFELLFLLTYFEDEEDYERCAVLDKMLRDGIKNVPKTNK